MNIELYMYGNVCSILDLILVGENLYINFMIISKAVVCGISLLHICIPFHVQQYCQPYNCSPMLIQFQP